MALILTCIAAMAYTYQPVRRLVHWVASTLCKYIKNPLTTQNPSQPIAPVSVNYHFSRKCNFQCGFCFHTELTSHVEPLDEMKRGLTLLKEAGMRKINFAGGEPLLYPKKTFLASGVLQGRESSISNQYPSSPMGVSWMRNF